MRQNINQQVKLVKANRQKMRQRIKLNINLNQSKNQNHKEQIKTCSTSSSYSCLTQIKTNNSDKINIRTNINGKFQDIYELKQKIGQGAHATVYKCIQKITKKQFAVKITKQVDQQLLQITKNQYQILQQLNHQNIIKAVSFYINKAKRTTYLVCQLFDFPQLGIYLRNQNLKLIQESQATYIISEILQTLEYLHSQGIAHRDIKPQNILYDPLSKKIKLIDFDCAKMKKQNQSKLQMWTKTGSLYYQAPQYFQQGVYSEKVDIWALGIIAYELITGTLPFKNNYYHRIVKMITQNQINLQNYQISEQIKLLVKKMLQKEPQKRLSASDCRKMPCLIKIRQNNMFKPIDNSYISDYQKYQELKCSSSNQQQEQLKDECFGNSSNQTNIKTLKYYCFVEI